MLIDADLDEALATLGDVLGARRVRFRALVIGGSSLLLLGLITRPTADVDVLASVGGAGYEPINELPDEVVDAVREVGDALGLGQRWMNAGPAGLVQFGLPEGLAERVDVRHYGALEVHIPAREDLVCFKLYAAVDHVTDQSKHFQDLQAMGATADELLRAARWSITHDPSLPYRGEVLRMLRLLGVEVDDADL